MKNLMLFLLLCTATFAGTSSLASVSAPIQQKSIDTRYYGDFVFHIDNATNEIVDITSSDPSVTVTAFLYSSLTPNTPTTGTYKVTGLKIRYSDSSGNQQAIFGPIYLADL